jgi:O-antigen/teichoic acid export membrane protein
MRDGSARTGIVVRIYGNLGRLLGGKAAAGLISLAYMAIAARALGPRDYGVLVLVHTYVLTVGGIIEFPGWQAVVRFGAQAQAAGDAPRLARLLGFTGLVEIAFGALAVITAALLAPLVGPRLGWTPVATAFAVPYSLAVLATVRSTPAGYLQLAGRFDLLGAHNAVAPTVRLVGAVIAALTGAGLKGFLIAWLIAALAEWAAMWILAALVGRRRLATGRDWHGLARAPAENPGLLRFMLATNADVTLSELAGRAAPLVVGWLLGPAAAGLYAIGQRATTVLAQPGLILGQAAYAELARLVAAGGGGRRIRAALATSIAIALFAAAPVCLAVALFGRPLASAMAGRAFAEAGVVMLWLMAARAILLAGPPLSAALTALGRPGLSVTANLISGPGLILLLPPLVAWGGLVGAGLHAVLQAAVGVAILAVCAWRETREPAAQLAGARA